MQCFKLPQNIFLFLYFYLPVQNTYNSVRRVLEPPQHLLHKLVLVPILSELDLRHFLLEHFQIRRLQKPHVLLVPYVQQLRIRVIAELPERVNRRHELALLQVLFRQRNHHQPNKGATGDEKRVPIEEVVDGNQHRFQVYFSGVVGGYVSEAGKWSEEVEHGK